MSTQREFRPAAPDPTPPPELPKSDADEPMDEDGKEENLDHQGDCSRSPCASTLSHSPTTPQENSNDRMDSRTRGITLHSSNSSPCLRNWKRPNCTTSLAPTNAGIPRSPLSSTSVHFLHIFENNTLTMSVDSDGARTLDRISTLSFDCYYLSYVVRTRSESVQC